MNIWIDQNLSRPRILESLTDCLILTDKRHNKSLLDLANLIQYYFIHIAHNGQIARWKK